MKEFFPGEHIPHSQVVAPPSVSGKSIGPSDGFRSRSGLPWSENGPNFANARLYVYNQFSGMEFSRARSDPEQGYSLSGVQRCPARLLGSGIRDCFQFRCFMRSPSPAVAVQAERRYQLRPYLNDKFKTFDVLAPVVFRTLHLFLYQLRCLRRGLLASLIIYLPFKRRRVKPPRIIKSLPNTWRCRVVAGEPSKEW